MSFTGTRSSQGRAWWLGWPGGPGETASSCLSVCLSVCAVLYAQSCTSRFLFLRMALLVTDQKQFFPLHDHPGDCCSFGLRLPKLQQVLPRCLMQVISLP